MADSQLQQLRHDLEATIAAYGSAVIGFSGGVDSSVVAAAAHAALGTRALAVTAITETITSEDVELASMIADAQGIAHRRIEYNELDIPNYAGNPVDRCYYCKDALFERLAGLARSEGFAVVLDGANADDASDYRPGRRAAAERNVRSPLLERGITKAAVRALAASYGLPNHDKPSAPCLSSRVPYGTPITREILEQVARAERSLRDMGFDELRVRHHGDLARVELPKAALPRAAALAGRIDDALTAAGYRYVTLDLRGFRSGALNEVLTQIQLPVP